MTKSSLPSSFSSSFLLVLLVLSLVWIRSSFTKWASGAFAATLGETLTKFASKNPYPWFKDFLENVAIPNSQLFGLLTIWGETFAAWGSALALLYLLWKKEPQKWAVVLLLGSLVVGAFLNLIFWLASGWTSPSADSLNLLMFLIQSIGIFFTLKLVRS